MNWCGGGYRASADDITNSPSVVFSPASRTDALYSLFAQDEVGLGGGRGNVTFGTKLEHNSYTGWEVQPSVRSAWTLGPRQTVWGAVSRAVRTPSRAESDVRIETIPVLSPASPLPVALSIRGTSDFRSETVRAYEVGYRVQPHERLSVDLTGFYNQHDNLRTTREGTAELQLTPFGPILVLPLFFDNEMFGSSYGLEAAATVELVSGWRMSGWYSRHEFNLKTPLGDVASSGSSSEDSPRNSVRLQSNIDLPNAFEFDTVYAYVGELVDLRVPGYSVLDVRVGWTPHPRVAFSVTLQNALNNQHIEFGSTLSEMPHLIGRRGVGRVTWSF